MCGRTSLFVPQWLLEDRFNATAIEPIKPRYNIAPETGRLAVIPNDRSDEIHQFKWGLIPFWVDDPTGDVPQPINARSDKVTESNLYKYAFKERRCLVLADGFYEWGGKRGSKQPYRITRSNNQPFAMAGMWERWEPVEEDQEAQPINSVTIITTDANELIEPIHDRMPVILSEDEEGTWLSDVDSETHAALLDPAQPDDLRMYPVSKGVNNPRTDSPDLVRRLATRTQTGLDDFTASD